MMADVEDGHSSQPQQSPQALEAKVATLQELLDKRNEEIANMM